MKWLPLWRAEVRKATENPVGPVTWFRRPSSWPFMAKLG